MSGRAACAAPRGMPRGAAALNRMSLRAALLRHLVEHRGVHAEARQIIILPSAQSAIELTARMLLNAGDIAWVESPGYGGARAAMEAAGAEVRGVPLDRNGLAWNGRRDRPRLIFVTPSHQHPTGRLMPINRRRELLRFADEAGATVIEDDYDSEIHYDGRPVAALQGLDATGRVFYVGTFSKSTFADIRCGYVIVPPDLAELFETAQRHSGQIMPAPVQDALAEFIDDGHFAAHIRKMTRIYRARRDRLVQALSAAAGAHLTLEPPAGASSCWRISMPGSTIARSPRAWPQPASPPGRCRRTSRVRSAARVCSSALPPGTSRRSTLPPRPSAGCSGT